MTLMHISMLGPLKSDYDTTTSITDGSTNKSLCHQYVYIYIYHWWVHYEVIMALVCIYISMLGPLRNDYDTNTYITDGYTRSDYDTNTYINVGSTKKVIMTVIHISLMGHKELIMTLIYGLDWQLRKSKVLYLGKYYTRIKNIFVSTLP